MNDLERRIEERKREAIEKRIGEKAKFISYHLGYCKAAGYGTEMPDEHFFSDNRFKIRHCGCTSVIYTDKLVYEGDTYDKEIRCYVPGEWEKELEKLYIKSEEARQNKIKEESDGKERRRIEEENELRKRFGL